MVLALIRKERIDEFRRKTLLHKASTAIERSRSIAVLELDPVPIVEDLERVRMQIRRKTSITVPPGRRKSAVL